MSTANGTHGVQAEDLGTSHVLQPHFLGCRLDKANNLFSNARIAHVSSICGALCHELLPVSHGIHGDVESGWYLVDDGQLCTIPALQHIIQTCIPPALSDAESF